MHHNVIGVVLAGGQSRRMGQNKALLARNAPAPQQVIAQTIEQSMLYFTCQQIVKAGVTQLIINGSSDAYSDHIIAHIAVNLAVPVARISDDEAAQGPVGGIASVLTHANVKTDSVYIFVPVDLPLLQALDLAQLIQGGCVNQRATHFEKQPLPLFIYDVTSGQKALEQQRVKNDRSVWCLASLLHALTLLSAEPSNWLNANTPQEWAKAQALINPN